jgi:alkylhydroperoxidase/carboxymuconolactone decarboxylase family protein YurZ
MGTAIIASGKEKFMLSENQRKMFADFHKSVEAEGTLDEKTSHMIKMAAAIAFGCYPWIEQLLGVAREKGISDDEIGAVQLHVMMVSAGRIMMQVDDVAG